MNTCENCKWFATRIYESNIPRIGVKTFTRHECRIRSTPTSFPERQPTDWCGEHIRKEYMS